MAPKFLTGAILVLAVPALLGADPVAAVARTDADVDPFAGQTVASLRVSSPRIHPGVDPCGIASKSNLRYGPAIDPCGSASGVIGPVSGACLGFQFARFGPEADPCGIASRSDFLGPVSRVCAQSQIARIGPQIDPCG